VTKLGRGLHLSINGAARTFHCVGLSNPDLGKLWVAVEEAKDSGSELWSSVHPATVEAQDQNFSSLWSRIYGTCFLNTLRSMHYREQFLVRVVDQESGYQCCNPDSLGLM